MLDIRLRRVGSQHIEGSWSCRASIAKSPIFPPAIPVFPLGGALLFPRGVLPLNMFEPRYLAMVDAALASHRLIGMIQPAFMFGPNAPLDDDRPPLSQVGCAGRITALQETDDGRYLIVLTGIVPLPRAAKNCRMSSPYRMVQADWTPFAEDLTPADLDDAARARLLDALTTYLKRGEFKADWEAVESAPLDTLINSLSAGCPFSNAGEAGAPRGAHTRGQVRGADNSATDGAPRSGRWIRSIATYPVSNAESASQWRP